MNLVHSHVNSTALNAHTATFRRSMSRLPRQRIDTCVPSVRRELVGKASGAFELSRWILPMVDLHPSHDGIRIAHLTDLHIGPFTPEFRLRSALRMIDVERPDLVLITGDLLTGHYPGCLNSLAILRDLRDPAYVTLGNHDHRVGAREIRCWLEKDGHIVLQDESRSIVRKRHPISILGIDDAATPRHSCPTHVFNVPSRDTLIVLAHRPSLTAQFPNNRDWLCLSGHTHGGNVVVPGITRTMYRALGQSYLSGLYQMGGSYLYVNRGLGFGFGIVPRFRARPEVAIFTLTARASEPR